MVPGYCSINFDWITLLNEENLDGKAKQWKMLLRGDENNFSKKRGFFSTGLEWKISAIIVGVVGIVWLIYLIDTVLLKRRVKLL